MATRQHRDVYVTNPRWNTLMRQAQNLHGPGPPANQEIDTTFEAALICFRRAAPSEVGDCMDLAKRVKAPRELSEATAASAST